MCGIFGVFNMTGGGLPRFERGLPLQVLRHRGPDDEGTFEDRRAFLGARRLAIIDPERGHQPVRDEADRLHLIMNGELYDYPRILEHLRARGHVLASRCDSEVAVHLFEEKWAGALEEVDGQYALAVYDAAGGRLLLARDRTGICPLFYAERGDLLLFASEMKAIFATGLLRPEIDPRAIDAVAAFGCVPAPRTIFRGVRCLPAAHLLEVKDGRLRMEQYWDIPYPDQGDYARRSESEWAEELRALLSAASRRRLRSDAPVGLYLSGGIDSASVAAMVADEEAIRTRVFSIGFPEPGFDESEKIRRLASYLGLEPRILLYTQKDLGADFPRLVYHAEAPTISTESVPLMALSGLASRQVKVVLTGEGSDEALGGYEYFQWEGLRLGGSKRLRERIALAAMRPVFSAAYGRDNPFFPNAGSSRWAEEVFGFYPAGMMQFHNWRALRRLTYSAGMLDRADRASDAELLDLPRERILRWDQMNRSLYVSSRVFLQGHLLATHGDRVLMANSVEGRYPFLDRTVQEFLARVPPDLKMAPNGLLPTEKYLLRRAMQGRLPEEVVHRRKKMFLAPFGTPFVGPDAPEYARELLSERALREYGYFDPLRVGAIVKEMEKIKEELGKDRGEHVRFGRRVWRRTLYGMALTLVLSTQLLESYVRDGTVAGTRRPVGTGRSLRYHWQP
jgi:asparagine synthase (glutamine-hydrolysing)